MIVVNIEKIIIYINVIKMTNNTLYTKVNLLFLWNIELSPYVKKLVIEFYCKID